MRGFQSQVGDVLGDGITGAALQAAFRGAVGLLHGLLGSHFGAEADELAETLGLDASELLVANLAYDLANAAGCSTFVQRSAAGPLHARNLDWGFPGKVLRDTTTVFRVTGGPAGDYAMVGWPGFFGGLTGLAPGRFSVTVNYVSHDEESGAWPAVKRALAGHWPVPWVVRHALDEADDFAAAVKLLRSAPLMTPVLFTVAGTELEEVVVVERSADRAFLRRECDGAVLTTNHYQARGLKGHNVDVDEMDTLERLERLEELVPGQPPIDSDEALEILSDDGILKSDTQHQVVMRPADGLLVLRVPGEPAQVVQLD